VNLELEKAKAKNVPINYWPLYLATRPKGLHTPILPVLYFLIGQKGMQLYTKGIEKIHKIIFGKPRESGTLRVKSPGVGVVFAPRPPGRFLSPEGGP
jgi:hypothetical protein